MDQQLPARYAQLSRLQRRSAVSLRRFWQAYWNLQARRAAAVIVHALDDDVFADIGVERREAEALFHNVITERRSSAAA